MKLRQNKWQLVLFINHIFKTYCYNYKEYKGCKSFFYIFKYLIIEAGTPATTQLGGTSLVTTVFIAQ
jgi:hypothetical protein